MKILWPHTFDPRNPYSGIFMNRHVMSLKKEGVKIQTLYLGRINNLNRLIKAVKIINSESKNFDIVHPQYGSSCSLACAFSKKRKILSLKGSDWFRLNAGKIKIRMHSALSTTFTRYTLRNYDSLIVMSYEMKNLIKQEFFKKNQINQLPPIYVIPDPIDLNLFSPIPQKEARIKFFNSNDVDKWILFISIDKNNPIKRYSLAEKSVDYARKFLPNIKFKIADRISPELMPQYLSCFDMVLSTSIYEGWPNNIKEALALSIPFVATNISDLAGIALRHKSCIIASPNPSDLGSAIIESLSNIHNKNNLRNEVLEMSMEKTNKKYIEIYKNVLKK